jgi:hypothetical protein
MATTMTLLSLRPCDFCLFWDSHAADLSGELLDALCGTRVIALRNTVTGFVYARSSTGLAGGQSDSSGVFVEVARLAIVSFYICR